jgi:flagellar hook assembly protein FlgD
VNDVLLIDADLINVLELRPFVASIHDLSGREVWRSESEHVAGPIVLRWAGDDTSGRRVPPGIYLLRIEIAGDGRRQAVAEIVRVAY